MSKQEMQILEKMRDDLIKRKDQMIWELIGATNELNNQIKIIELRLKEG